MHHQNILSVDRQKSLSQVKCWWPERCYNLILGNFEILVQARPAKHFYDHKHLTKATPIIDINYTLFSGTCSKILKPDVLSLPFLRYAFAGGYVDLNSCFNP